MVDVVVFLLKTVVVETDLSGGAVVVVRKDKVVVVNRDNVVVVCLERVVIVALDRVVVLRDKVVVVALDRVVVLRDKVVVVALDNVVVVASLEPVSRELSRAREYPANKNVINNANTIICFFIIITPLKNNIDYIRDLNEYKKASTIHRLSY